MHTLQHQSSGTKPLRTARARFLVASAFGGLLLLGSLGTALAAEPPTSLTGTVRAALSQREFIVERSNGHNYKVRLSPDNNVKVGDRISVSGEWDGNRLIVGGSFTDSGPGAPAPVVAVPAPVAAPTTAHREQHHNKFNDEQIDHDD
jgi:hypothetical protein